MKYMTLCSRMLASAAIILLCLWSAKGVLALFGIAFPAPVLGMVLLFTLMISGLIKESWVMPFATPLLNYMPILFIPAGVGLVDYLPLVAAHWPVLISILIVVPLATLALVGHLIQWMNRQ